ncbi:TPA: trypsin-like serine protease [Staphylococcus aureus]|nr:trypsin-like serine protease [Staphylococcus aureus]MBL0430707.1 trypsin-like serine protease [Staphylococcus aureus]HDH0858027.1 trypsin-like serine protease [Staphylococcus aureus]HDH5694721.1 trypsin-like serine protease [Staphylococcus aureus]HDH5697452.1 trypsin-like serine protease [Staphylococcus aureus]HDP6026707.1 trypsin-like serine protease [Staphylococcus aureus]
MKKTIKKLSLSILLLTGITIGGLNYNNVNAETTGTMSIVKDTTKDSIGKRVGVFEGPTTCTATMLNPNFGLTAAHCGNGFEEGNIGKVYPAQSALSTPYGSMTISLFNPYDNKDIAFIYGRNSDKDKSYRYYESTFAGTEIKLKGFTKSELSNLVGKKVFSYGYPYDYDGYKQYKFTGEITVSNEHAIHTTIPSYGGQSGSAVFLEDSKELLGVLIQTGTTNSTAILQPITTEVANWYNTKKNQLESSSND